jgi:hypothetical protein
MRPRTWLPSWKDTSKGAQSAGCYAGGWLDLRSFPYVLHPGDGRTRAFAGSGGIEGGKLRKKRSHTD